MSYSENIGSFLLPIIPVGTTDAGVMLEMDIGAASADHGELLCVKSCRIKRLKFTVVSEAVNGDTTAPTVVFTKRPTPLSDTDESVIGTLTIPDGTAVGASIYLDVDVALAVGDSVEVSHTVGVGSPAGQGFPSLECVEAPEEAGNNTELTASA